MACWPTTCGKSRLIAPLSGDCSTVTDFEYEMHMGMMNKMLIPEIDTIFIMSNTDYIFVSSSAVKEAAL